MTALARTNPSSRLSLAVAAFSAQAFGAITAQEAVWARKVMSDLPTARPLPSVWPFVANDPAVPFTAGAKAGSNAANMEKAIASLSKHLVRSITGQSGRDRSTAPKPSTKVQAKVPAKAPMKPMKPASKPIAKTTSVPAPGARPSLSVALVGGWVKAHQAATGFAPTCTEKTPAPDGSTWAAINTAMSKGCRGWDGEPQGLASFVRSEFPSLPRKGMKA